MKGDIMTIAKLDHIYLFVKDLDRAVKFYEAFLGMKATERFEDRWAGFGGKKGFNLGLFNLSFDKKIIETAPNYNDYMDDNYKDFVTNEAHKIGNNAIVAFFTDDVEAEHQRVKSLDPKPLFITKILTVNFMVPYHFFQFVDPEGNTIEVYKIELKP